MPRTMLHHSTKHFIQIKTLNLMIFFFFFILIYNTQCDPIRFFYLLCALTSGLQRRFI